MYDQMILTRVPRPFNEGRAAVLLFFFVFFFNCAGKTGYPRVKEGNWTLSLYYIQKQLARTGSKT